MSDEPFYLRAGDAGRVVGGVPGHVLTVQADGRIKPQAAAGGGGAPLPNTYWVSPLAIGSSEDGSAANPFLTPQAAMNKLELDAVPGVLLLADGDYSAQQLVVASQNVSIYAFGSGNGGVFMDRLTVAGAALIVYVQRMVLADLRVEAGALLSLFQVTWLGATLTDANLRLLNCSGPLPVSGGNCSVTAYDSDIGFVGTAGLPFFQAKLVDCVVGSNVLATTVELVDSSCQRIEADTLSARGATITGTVAAATSSFLDSFSLQSIRTAAQLGNALGTLTISDRPTSLLAFVVPALAAATADVTVALPGAKPGDTFALASNVAARLAGIGIVDAWSPAADQLTVRFFGTTAGGAASFDVSQFTNAA